jgi:hypothetical protein
MVQPCHRGLVRAHGGPIGSGRYTVLPAFLFAALGRASCGDADTSDNGAFLPPSERWTFLRETVSASGILG